MAVGLRPTEPDDAPTKRDRNSATNTGFTTVVRSRHRGGRPDGSHLEWRREPVASRINRGAWGAGRRLALDRADIVFLDRDNGIGEETWKHATTSEIRLLRRPGRRAIVFIAFPGRTMPHDSLGPLAEVEANSVFTQRTTVSVPRVRAQLEVAHLAGNL